MHLREVDRSVFVDSQKGLAFAPVAVWSNWQAAGTVFPSHCHASGQLVYAVSGVMIVRTGMGSWRVPVGRAVWLPGGVRHEIEVRRDVQMRSVYMSEQAQKLLPPSGPEAGPRQLAHCKMIRVSPLLRELIAAASDLHAQVAHGEQERHLFALILHEIGRATPFVTS
jgi:hypothetical protein